MPGYRIVFIQTGSGSASQGTPAAPAAPPVPNRDQLREQIRQTIQDAQAAAREARAAQAATTVTTGDGRVIRIDGRPVIAGDVRGIPGQVTIQRDGMQDIIPPQAVDISIAFFVMLAVIIIGWPLARAMGRRLERRADAPALPDPAIAAQLQRIEQAVEAMSIEVERISESQRFMAKLQSGAAGDRAALGTAERR
ncbi:MAG TPA: hypothetical protein VFI52_09425 [Gemmatimonadaceae bacterium]|nr:hypothetical protein [Gemmatimonadaceae bacterium]